MRLGRGHRALAVVLSCATVGTCVFPTERDESVRVSIDPLPLLIRGNDTYATARAWQLAGGDSQPLPNVTFVWSSDSASIATVDATGHVVGIRSGTTTIRARAVNFDRQSVPGQITLRVSNTLEIDSLIPADTVRYGELVTVYGVGLLDTLGIALAIGDGVLIRVPFTDVLRADGASQRGYWVPPPAHTAPLSYISLGAGVFGSTIDTVQVVPQDVYEPSDTVPSLIDLDTSRPFPGTDFHAALIYNPALAFEELPRDQGQGVDWYRLSQAAPRDLTIVLASENPGTFETFLTDSLRFQASDTTYRIGPGSWTFGPGSHACHGAAFAPDQTPSESTVVALKDFPAAALHAIASYTRRGRYTLSVVEEYIVAGKGITFDSHEEDDYCDAADSNATALPFRDSTLTIDNPHDVDWFRFSFPGGTFQASTIGSASASGKPSDIDLYLLRVPSAGQAQMTIAKSSTSSRSDENIQYDGFLSGSLSAGQYYLVVVDYAGVPTRYSLCFRSGTCSPPAIPPAPSAAEIQASAARRARLEAAMARRSPGFAVPRAPREPR
jgi:hypothetical protein